MNRYLGLYMTVQYGHFNSVDDFKRMKTIIPLFNKKFSQKTATAVAALGIAVAMSACATTSDHTLDNPQLKTYAAKQASISELLWWKRYNDPQLDDLMMKAFYNSPDLAQATARLYKAESAAKGSKSKTYPSASVLATGQSLSALGGESALDSLGLVGINFGYEIDFWGKQRAAIAAATSQSQAAEADCHQAMLILSSAIASSYFDLGRLYEDRDVLERAVALKKENLGIVKQRHDQGLVSNAEVELGTAGVFNAEQELGAADESIALARNAIAALAGQAPGFGQTIKRPVLANIATPALPERIDLDLIGRRPDVVAARWRAEAASQGIRKARASFYPNVNLMAFVGHIELGSPLSEGMNTGSFGPALSLPLFDGFKLQSDLKIAKGEHAQALAVYNGAVINAMHDVADAAASEKALGVRLDAAANALKSSEEAYRLAKLRYEGGLSDYTTLLLAEQNLLTQRRLNANLKARAQILDIALLKALGGPF
jgi:NodT family efflux transporter outer membrane factor (OMF) lipoprotein